MTKKCKHVLILAVILSGLFNASTSTSNGSGEVFDVTKFGAVGDGKHNDTSAITKALDAADKAGGGIVLLPAPGIYLSGSQHMRSHTVFRIEHGATLLGSTIYTDYPYEWIPGGPNSSDSWARQSLIAGAKCAAIRTKSSTNGCPVSWKRLQNVTIDGGGTIDGQGHAWWWASDAGSPAAHARPDMVQPVMVDGLILRDITLRASPAWTMHPTLCTDVLAENLVVESGQFDQDQQYSGHNVDGFDPDSSSNVILRNSIIHAGDDCVAIYSNHAPTNNVTVSNVTCHTPLSVTHGAFGTSNVLFENCTVYGNWGGDHTYKPRWWKTGMRLKTDRNTNGPIRNIAYHNINVVDVDLVFDIQMWYPCQNQSGMENYRLCRSFYPVQPDKHPHISDISIVNITGTAWRAGWLNCLPESPCDNIQIESVQVPGANEWVCENVRGENKNGNIPSASTCFA